MEWGEVVVIFGGSGFVGSHMAMLLINTNKCSKVILADIVEPDLDRFGDVMANLIGDGRILYIHCDVRNISTFQDLPDMNVSNVINLAAIHREPGHAPKEYFETNLLGAENVCSWVDSIECQCLVFTSSISPYGSCDDEVDECSLPCPETAYGASKLAAEKIHLAWQNQDKKGRQLIIVRPGVVFGPGEKGGNVTRLVRSVLGRYFFYMGNRMTVKAGIYVKELCNSIVWASGKLELNKQGVFLYNATMMPAPSVEEYVTVICVTAGVKRKIMSVPFWVLYTASATIELFAKPLGIQHPFSPVRIKKLIRSNNVYAKILNDQGYRYAYSLKLAMEDWKNDFPSDWS